MVDANPSKISKRFLHCFHGLAKIEFVEWERDYLLVVEDKEIATWVQDRPLLLPDTDCIQLQYNKVLRVLNNTSEVCIIITSYTDHSPIG